MTRDDLKAKIKDLAAQGYALRERIQKTAGLERHTLWNEKRSVGRKARAALLAYGFLRGVPYRRIEPRCHADAALRPSLLLAMWTRDLAIQPDWNAERETTSGAPQPGRNGLLGFLGSLIVGPARVEIEPPAPTWSESRVAAWLEAPLALQAQEAAVR